MEIKFYNMGNKFLFCKFSSTGNIPGMNYARDPKGLLYLYTTTDMDSVNSNRQWTAARATHPLIICTLQHTTGGSDVGPTCNT